MAPFGAEALAALELAHEAQDWDTSVEIVNRDISGFDAEHVTRLRANDTAWHLWGSPRAYSCRPRR